MRILIYGFVMMIFSINNLEAKNDYYTIDELECVNSNECYIKGTKNLFSGELRYFYNNERVFKQINYKNGKLHGGSAEYYENGNAKRIAFYKNGLLNGVYREFYENRGLKKVVMYEEGKKDGLYRVYHENGEVKEDKKYDKDKEDGRARLFYDNGELYVDMKYKNGNLIDVYCLNRNGKRYNMNTQKDEFKKYGRAICNKVDD